MAFGDGFLKSILWCLFWVLVIIILAGQTCHERNVTKQEKRIEKLLNKKYVIPAKSEVGKWLASESEEERHKDEHMAEDTYKTLIKAKNTKMNILGKFETSYLYYKLEYKEFLNKYFLEFLREREEYRIKNHTDLDFLKWYELRNRIKIESDYTYKQILSDTRPYQRIDNKSEENTKIKTNIKEDTSKTDTNSTYYDEGVVINGVRWATRNVGTPGTFAANPESSGWYYQWNRIVGWSPTGQIVNSNGSTTWKRSTPTGTTWTEANDPCPTDWRIPTLNELKKLLEVDKVSHEGTAQNDVRGIKFIDKSSHNSIFLSSAGYREPDNGTLGNVSWSGHYWCNAIAQQNRELAYDMYFTNSEAVIGNSHYRDGLTIRCVKK